MMTRFLQFWINKPVSNAAWVFPVGYMLLLQLLTGIPKPEFWEQIDELDGFWEFSKIIYDYPYYLQDLSHFPLFAALAWLWSWYFGGPDQGKRFHGTALTIAMTYAIFNECLQVVLPTRFLSTSDLLMNAAGVLFGGWLHGFALRLISPTVKTWKPTRKTQGLPYGLAADFNSAQEIFEAAGKVRGRGFTQWECYTPFAVHGLDKQMGMPRSKVPVFTFIGGAFGFFTGVLIVWYMNSFDYPLIVGGKPFFSPIYPFPVFYELTILLAAFGTFFGMFLTNRLPRHNHPIFEYERFATTSDDKFAIVIESSDEKYDEVKTKAFLKEIGGQRIMEIHEEEA